MERLAEHYSRQNMVSEEALNAIDRRVLTSSEGAKL